MELRQHLCAINQLALQALIDAVIWGLDGVDEALMKRFVRALPSYRGWVCGAP